MKIWLTVLTLTFGGATHAATLSLNLVSDVGTDAVQPCNLSVSVDAADADSILTDSCRSGYGDAEVKSTAWASGRAEFGSIGLLVRADGSAKLPDVTIAAASAQVSVLDQLFLPVERGFVRLSYDAVAFFAARSVTLEGWSVTLEIMAEAVLSSNAGAVELMRSSISSALGFQARRGTVDIPFENGVMQFQLSAVSYNACGLNNIGNCVSETSFLNSARITGAQLFDIDGVELDLPFYSESGFDYKKGWPPHTTAVVPLPASLGLLASGIGLLLLRRVARQASLLERNA